MQARFVVGDGRHLPFRNETFDVVFSYSVLQHLSRGNVQRALSEMRRVLTSGGRAVVEMPHRQRSSRVRFTCLDGPLVASHTGLRTPMPLDLSSLTDALAALNGSLRYLKSDLAADQGLRDQFRGAAIQAFEFTYELAFKFMKRHLERLAAVPSALDEMSFMQVVRAAAEAGLVQDVSRFHAYREARNITSHSYDRLKADRILATLPEFAADVAALLAQLEARNSVDA